MDFDTCLPESYISSFKVEKCRSLYQRGEYLVTRFYLSNNFTQNSVWQLLCIIHDEN